MSYKGLEPRTFDVTTLIWGLSSFIRSIRRLPYKCILVLEKANVFKFYLEKGRLKEK